MENLVELLQFRCAIMLQSLSLKRTHCLTLYKTFENIKTVVRLMHRMNLTLLNSKLKPLLILYTLKIGYDCFSQLLNIIGIDFYGTLEPVLWSGLVGGGPSRSERLAIIAYLSTLDLYFFMMP